MRLIVTMSIVLACAVGCQSASPPAKADDSASQAKESAIASSPSAVAGDAARGKARSAELYCDACHGNNGNSETSEWPSIAGQNAAYLANQLELLRSGKRASPEMQPMAAPLSDADIADLAAHYAAQTAATVAAASSNETKIGEALYRNGDPSRSIPSCSSCHGANGQGNPATGDPAVRAQQPGYTNRQLEAYAKHTRYSGDAQAEQNNANLKIMRETAEKLTAEEIRSLAAYLRTMH
jgi:cytochrome c553